MGEQGYQERLNGISERFRSRLSQRIDTLRSLSDQTDMQSTEEMRRMLHDMAGNAPTLGFTEIGRQAAELERIVVKAIDRQNAMSEDEKNAFEDGFARLENLVNEAG